MLLACACLLQVGPKAFPRVAMDLATTVERIQQNFVICDPSLPDCPIVFASDAFLELTGFPREEVLGRNCRFLQVRLIAAAAGPCFVIRVLPQAESGSGFSHVPAVASRRVQQCFAASGSDHAVARRGLGAALCCWQRLASKVAAECHCVQDACDGC